MHNLYDDILQNQILPNAFSDWAAYRKRLTDFILESTEPETSALIVGAGECNDFDLVRLKRHFCKVMLLDQSEQAMITGLTRQRAPFMPDEIMCADLAGIAPDAYRRIADQMLALLRRELQSRHPDEDRFERAFLRQMASAFQTRQPDALMQQSSLVDYVICCGVHSQLLTIFPQMALVYRRYIPIRYETAAGFVREQVFSVISDLNDALLRWARKGLILGLEESRLGMDGGIDGAWQAMRDIDARRLSLQAQIRLEWPFDPARGKSYLMRVMAIDRPQSHTNRNARRREI